MTLIHVGPFHLGAIELLWIALAVGGLLAALWSLGDALANRAAVYQLNGPVTEQAASDSVWDEVVRAAVQAVLVALAVPASLQDREITLSPFLLGLIAVNVLVSVNTFRSVRNRRRLARLAAQPYHRRRDDPKPADVT
jgi:hypothetical protein